MKKYNIIILLLVILALVLGFYYQNDILNIYKKTSKSFTDFQKNDLENVLKEIKREILVSSPLNVGGEENQTVLTKEKIIAQTNIQRYNNGLLAPLVSNQKLEEAARAKAEDMFLNQYFEHVSPSGVDPGKLVKNYGYDYIITGENLILGNFEDETDVVQKWMDSPGHRANILNKRFAEIGVAVIKGEYKGQTVWIGVQEFGLPMSYCKSPEIDIKDKIDNNKSELDQLSVKIDAKRSEIENTNPRSEKYNGLIDEYNEMVNVYNSLNNETKLLINEYNEQVNIFNNCVMG